MLTLDGLVIAVMAALAQDQLKRMPSESIILAIIVIIALAVAVLACLLIINVKCPFLGHINPGTRSGLTKEIDELEKEVGRRTKYLSIAWWSNLIALGLPSLAALYALAISLARAFGVLS